MSTLPPLGGVVLAGGQSRRMGAPKAFLRLTPDGPTLIELVLARLDAVTGEVVVVTNTPDAYAHLGRRMVPDTFAGLGTLAGIHAGLTASRHAHSLIVACDMPFLEPRLLAYMAARPRSYDALVPQIIAGRAETLHAIYGRACLAPIERRLRAGEAKVDRFFAEVRVEYLDEATLRQFDPDLRSLSNLNTPEELAVARKASTEYRVLSTEY